MCDTRGFCLYTESRTQDMALGGPAVQISSVSQPVFYVILGVRCTRTGIGDLSDTASIRGLDTVVVTNSIVRGRISDYILIASRRYD